MLRLKGAVNETIQFECFCHAHTIVHPWYPVAKGVTWHEQDYIDFSQTGKILVCSTVPKLGGLGVCSPSKILIFTTTLNRGRISSAYFLGGDGGGTSTPLK